MARRRGKGAIEIVPTADWPRVIRALAVASDVFADQLEELASERLGRASEDAKAKLMSMPSRGTSIRNARATIAQALSYTTDRSQSGGIASGGHEFYARAEVSGLPPDYQALPRAFDKRRFRHPVYGNRGAWVDQRGKPWFTRTMYQAGRDLEGDISDLMDKVVRTIGASG